MACSHFGSLSRDMGLKRKKGCLQIVCQEKRQTLHALAYECMNAHPFGTFTPSQYRLLSLSLYVNIHCARSAADPTGEDLLLPLPTPLWSASLALRCPVDDADASEPAGFAVVVGE